MLAFFERQQSYNLQMVQQELVQLPFQLPNQFDANRMGGGNAAHAVNFLIDNSFST
jgi:hypothetical protein